MRLFLTSGGLTTKVLRDKFLELAGENLEGIKVAFIETASKVEKDRSYVERDIKNLKKTGITQIDKIDISDPREEWENILHKADVIWVEGGNTFYLLNEVNKSGLNKKLKEVIKNKLYVGVSAGSILVTPTIEIAEVEPRDQNDWIVDLTSLNWVDFEISPHTPSFVPLKNVEEYAKKSGRKVLAYDDTTAVFVEDDKLEVIGDGFYKELN